MTTGTADRRRRCGRDTRTLPAGRPGSGRTDSGRLGPGAGLRRRPVVRGRPPGGDTRGLDVVAGATNDRSGNTTDAPSTGVGQLGLDRVGQVVAPRAVMGPDPDHGPRVLGVNCPSRWERRTIPTRNVTAAVARPPMIATVITNRVRSFSGQSTSSRIGRISTAPTTKPTTAPTSPPRIIGPLTMALGPTRAASSSSARWLIASASNASSSSPTLTSRSGCAARTRVAAPPASSRRVKVAIRDPSTSSSSCRRRTGQQAPTRHRRGSDPRTSGAALATIDDEDRSRSQLDALRRPGDVAPLEQDVAVEGGRPSLAGAAQVGQHAQGSPTYRHHRPRPLDLVVARSGPGTRARDGTCGAR